MATIAAVWKGFDGRSELSLLLPAAGSDTLPSNCGDFFTNGIHGRQSWQTEMKPEELFSAKWRS
jgi:hypothetical protein